MKQQLTTAALFRQRGENRRVRAAFASLKKTTTHPWTERNPLGQERLEGTADREWASEMGMSIGLVEVEKIVNNKVIRIPQHRLVVTEQNRDRIIRRIENWAPDAIRIKDTDPDAKTVDVVESVLPDGRVICVPSRQTSFLQRCVVNVLNPRLEEHGVFSDHLHSYRPARGTKTALADISRVALDKPFYAKGDIKSFFPSVSHELVRDAMKELCPWISEDLRQTIIWLISPGGIVRRPNHPERLAGNSPRREPGPKCLLQGDVLSPLLSNLVGTYLLDRTLAPHTSPCVDIVRYSDDFVILGSNRDDVEETMALVKAVLGAASLMLHSKKTMWEARDIRITPLAFLGKIAVGSKVYTPSTTLETWASGLVTIDPISGLYGRMVFEILDNLTIDDFKKLSFFEAQIRTLGGIDARTNFRDARRRWADARGRGEPRPEPDPEDDYDLIGGPRGLTTVQKYTPFQEGAFRENSGIGGASAPSKHKGADHMLPIEERSETRGRDDEMFSVGDMPILSTGTPTATREIMFPTRRVISLVGTQSEGITASLRGTLDAHGREEFLKKARGQDELGGSPGVRAPTTVLGSSRESSLGEAHRHSIIGAGDHCTESAHSLATFGALTR